MRFDYSLSANVLHSHSPPTLAAVKHNSSVISSYFNVAPGMTCTCVTVSPGLFVFVDDAEHPVTLRQLLQKLTSATRRYTQYDYFFLYAPYKSDTGVFSNIWISFLCALCSLKISARLLPPKARPIPVAAAESNVNCGMASEAIPNVAVPAKINPDEIFFSLNS